MSDQGSSNSTSVGSANSSSEEKSTSRALSISSEDFQEDAGVEEALYAYLARGILIPRFTRYCNFCIRIVEQDKSLNEHQQAEIIRQITDRYQRWLKAANSNVKEAFPDAFQFCDYTGSYVKSLELLSSQVKADLQNVQRMTLEEMQRQSLYEPPLPVIKVLVDRIIDLAESDELHIEAQLFERIKQIQLSLSVLSPEELSSPSFAIAMSVFIQLDTIVNYAPGITISQTEKDKERKSPEDEKAVKEAQQERRIDFEETSKFKQLSKHYSNFLHAQTNSRISQFSQQELFDYFDTTYPFLKARGKELALQMMDARSDPVFTDEVRRLIAKNRCNLLDTIKAKLQKLWSEIKNQDRWLVLLFFIASAVFATWSIVSQTTLFNLPFIAVNAPILAIVFAVLTGIKLLWDFFATRPDYYKYWQIKFEAVQPEFYQSKDVPFFRLYLLAYNQMHWFWRYAALALVAVGIGLIAYGLTIENTGLILDGAIGAAVVLIFHAIHIAGSAYDLSKVESGGESKTTEEASPQYVAIHQKVVGQSSALTVAPSPKSEEAASTPTVPSAVSRF